MIRQITARISMCITVGACLLIYINCANAQIQVYLQQPPPNQLLIEDLWKVRIVNSSINTYNVFLTASASESTMGPVLDGTSKSFLLLPGVKYVQPPDLGAVDVHYSNEDVKNMIKKTGTVPAGHYEICINVINDDGSGITLASTCISQEVNNFTKPVLISPDDKSQLSDKLPIFNWLPPTPVRTNQQLTYTLKVVEILSGQTATDAMRSNPEWYIKSNIAIPIYQYSFMSRGFASGQHYAWKVLAYVEGNYINESVIREFVYNQNDTLAQTTSENKSKKLNNKRKYNLGSSQPNQDLWREYIPSLSDEITGFYVNSTDQEQMSTSYNPFRNIGYAGSEPDTGNFKTPNFKLSGSNRFYVQNANRQGTNQLLPQRFARWEFNPSFNVYKVPFTLNLLLSTEQIGSKQNIDNLSIGFDPATLIDQAKTRLPNQSLISDKLIEYDKLKSFLEDPQSLKDMTRLKELENSSSLDSAQRQEYFELQSKAKEYEDAKQKLQELEQVKKDVDEIRNTVDPNIAVEKLKKYGAFSSFNSFLLDFKTFGIATTYPSFTDLTLNGVPVTGANIEFNPSLFYFAITGIRNNKAIQVSDDGQPVFARKIFSTRLGVGKYDGTHFYFTYLYAKDDENSVHTDTTTIVTPAKDHLLGIQAQLAAFNNRLVIEGEISGSLYTRDVTSPEIENSAIPESLKRIFGIKMSSSFDYAYMTKGTLNLDKYGTKFSVGINMTGPGYISLGAPNIRNDNFGFDLKLDQSLLKNQITFSGSLRREKDNLISWKSSTTVNTLGNATLNLRFKNMPYLLVVFSPNSQLNNQTADSLKVDNKTTLVNLSTGYGFNYINIFTFINLSYSQQSGKTLLALGNYSTRNFNAMANLSFSFPFSLTLGYNFSGSKMQDVTDNINSFDLGGSYTFFNRWQNTLGSDYSRETGNNKKISIYYSTSIQLWKFGTFDLRAEKNIYKENSQSSNNYDEFVLKATISSTW